MIRHKSERLVRLMAGLAVNNGQANEGNTVVVSCVNEMLMRPQARNARVRYRRTYSWSGDPAMNGQYYVELGKHCLVCTYACSRVSSDGHIGHEATSCGQTVHAYEQYYYISSIYDHQKNCIAHGHLVARKQRNSILKT